MQFAFLNEPIYQLIGKCADELGGEAYLIGGFVRDIFLERQSKDIDIVTVGRGIDIATKVKENLGNEWHLSILKNFGTAQIKYTEL